MKHRLRAVEAAVILAVLAFAWPSLAQLPNYGQFVSVTPYQQPWQAQGNFIHQPQPSVVQQQQQVEAAFQRCVQELQQIQQQLSVLEGNWQQGFARHRQLETFVAGAMQELQMIDVQLRQMHPNDPRRMALMQRGAFLQQEIRKAQMEGGHLQQMAHEIEQQGQQLKMRYVQRSNECGALANQRGRLAYQAAQQVVAAHAPNAQFAAVNSALNDYLSVAGRDPTSAVSQLLAVSGVPSDVASTLRTRLPGFLEAYSQGQVAPHAVDTALAELYDRNVINDGQQALLQKLAGVRRLSDVGGVLQSPQAVGVIGELIGRLVRR